MVDPHLSGRFLFQSSTDQWLTLTFLEGFYYKVQQSHRWLTPPFWNASISRFNSPTVDPHLSGSFLFQCSTDHWLNLTLLKGFMVDPHLSGRFLFQGSTVPPMVDPHLSGRFLFQGSTDQWLMEGFYFKGQQTNG